MIKLAEEKDRELTEEQHEATIIEWIKVISSLDVTAKDISVGVAFSEYGFDFKIKSDDDARRAKSKIYSIAVYREGYLIYGVGVSNFKDYIRSTAGYSEYLGMLNNIRLLFMDFVSLQNEVEPPVEDHQS